MFKINSYNTISILGSSGGVAKSILSILNNSISDKNDPIHKYIYNSKIYLIDKHQKELDYFQIFFPNLIEKLVLCQFDLQDTTKLKKHLVNTNTTVVIDVSFCDTVNMLSCCNKLGIKYINTALENELVDEDEYGIYEGVGLSERYNIFESNKNKFKNTTAIVCSGMNPGVIQWMTLEAIKNNNNKIPKACYIVELDTSFYKDKNLADKNTLYTTWSTECFLDEAILSYPLFVQQHTPLLMYNKVYELDFKVRLGDIYFNGCLMPHEEVLTLGNLYNMEIGFIYKINQHTTDLIRDHLDNLDILWEYPMKVLDPNDYPLSGEDLIGVLLIYEDREYYMYNILSNDEIFKKYKTNATYFQVACGIYGALCTILLDNLERNIYYVDELILNTNSKYGEYLSYYMQNFVVGVNSSSDGLLLDRMVNYKKNI